MNIGVLTTAEGKRDLLAALNAMVRWNVYLFTTRPGLPPLYESGIRYVREDEAADPQRASFPAIERWQMADVLAVTKRGDCEDLAMYRVGWLRAHGENARIRLTRRGNIWHVTLFRADGRIEDPSARLGMR